MTTATRKKWSPEARQAASERAKARHLSQNEVLILKSKQASTLEEVVERNEDGDVAVASRTGSRMVDMYKRDQYGWIPVKVDSNNLAVVLGSEGKGNYSANCPACGGYCGYDKPCTERPIFSFRRCPVPSCRKKIYDRPFFDEREVQEDEVGEIKDDSYLESTPELRTKASLDSHLFFYHPSEAASMAPQSPRNPLRVAPAGRLSEVS